MECSPSTAGKESFYFGYIAHNYHSKFQSRRDTRVSHQYIVYGTAYFALILTTAFYNLLQWLFTVPFWEEWRKKRCRLPTN
jgi:uncharacterized membrane protein